MLCTFLRSLKFWLPKITKHMNYYHLYNIYLKYIIVWCSHILKQLMNNDIQLQSNFHPMCFFPMSITRKNFLKKNLVNHFDANLNSLSNVCFFGQNNIPKVWPEKYDFDLYKGFFMDKIIQTCQILKGIFFFQITRFYDKF